MKLIDRTRGQKLWKPPALRAPVLLVTVLLCWGLIAILQYLLTRSQKDNGIIFARKINDLPLSKTFMYKYFPTILAVVYSVYWAWIDLETKRLEPYYQLSKKDGALGKDSLLLHYPFDFIPWVPFKALKDRHWPVFWASFAVVLVTWGLVPTQSGIFSVQRVTTTQNATFHVSTTRVPVEEQASTLTLRYAQSTYGIASLNETLPPFMARNYTLAPFTRLDAQPSAMNVKDGFDQGSWAASTTMYFVELHCEDVSHVSDKSKEIIYTSNSGCNFTLGLNGNLTIGENPHSGMEGTTLAIKEFSGMYVGYEDPNGFAQYSLDQGCPKNQTSIFYAAFQRNKKHDTDPPQDVTAIYCEPQYYQQAVLAKVDMITQRPIAITPLKDKEVIAPGVFNSSTFEVLLTASSLSKEVRGNIMPAKAAPKYRETLAELNLSLTSGGAGGTPVNPMVGLAVAVGNHSQLQDYLDWKVLSKSYADAYRLIFARAMVEVLNPPAGMKSTSAPTSISGLQKVTTEAVVLEPVFVYIVEGFLGVVSLCTIALLILTLTRRRNLRSSPGSIASVMSLTADCQQLLSDFKNLDCCTAKEINNFVSQKRYKLIQDDDRTGIIEMVPNEDGMEDPQSPMLTQGRQNIPSDIAKPVRPFEFSLWFALPLLSLFLALIIGLAIIFVRARKQGLPLPSTDKFVQNLLENYIPTAIATMIEPIWILINRLLCLLQPLEELRDCNAQAVRSINLDYSSLPPQLIAVKAARTKHFVLAAVCTMGLLANILAIAFAALFEQDTIEIGSPVTLFSGLDLKFVSINGSIGPDATQEYGSMNTSGAFKGGDGEDQFLVSESNYTRGTSLPAWTDNKLFYLPFFSETSVPGDGRAYEAVTRAFGAEMDCTKIEIGNSFQAELQKKVPTVSSIHVSINATITRGSSTVQCRELDNTALRPGPIGQPCVTGPSATELITALYPKTGNATQIETDTCGETVILGWLRNHDKQCGNVTSQALTSLNSTFLQCTPKWVTGTARIRVDASGRLTAPAEDLNLMRQKSPAGTTELFQHLFSNDPVNLARQSNLYLFKSGSAGWHNDSFADDFLNYFMFRASNNSDLVSPTKDVPSFDAVMQPLNQAYSSLFAIWLGLNKDKLLLSNEVTSQGRTKQLQTESIQYRSETRLFVSTTMFIISEAILSVYVIVAILVYLRRPGRYLPRMPVNIASVIALFAASSAVQDLSNTSHLDRKGRAQHLQAVDSRYGYGSFVSGGDGRVHIGIEKTPFVRKRTKTRWIEKGVHLRSKWTVGN